MNTRLPLTVALLCAGCGGGTGSAPEDSKGQPDSAAAAQPRMETEMGGMSAMAMSDGLIRVTRRQASLAGVTFAVAAEAPLEQTVRAVAMVVPNERGLGVVNARITGWIERLFVNETGASVEEGAPLFELYAPELVAAQEELLLARRLGDAAGGDTMVQAARRRMALWNVPDQTVADIESTGVVRRRITISSPYRGHVLGKHVIEGQMVRAGDRLFELADLSTVWIEPAVFERDIALVRVGQRADITLDALPGRTFGGRVTFLHPTLDPATRTLRVRVELANPQGLLKPRMYGTVKIRTAGRRGVIVPLTAVLPTGDRDIAFVLRSGAVAPTDVSVGARGDSHVLVTGGLAAGDTVVASATFLFDSESNLGAAMAGIMLDMGMGLDMGGMDMGTMPMAMPDSASGSTMRDSMPGMADTGRSR